MRACMRAGGHACVSGLKYEPYSSRTVSHAHDNSTSCIGTNVQILLGGKMEAVASVVTPLLSHVYKSLVSIYVVAGSIRDILFS